MFQRSSSSMTKDESALNLSMKHSWPEACFADRYVDHKQLWMLTNIGNASHH